MAKDEIMAMIPPELQETLLVSMLLSLAINVIAPNKDLPLLRTVAASISFGVGIFFLLTRIGYSQGIVIAAVAIVSAFPQYIIDGFKKAIPVIFAAVTDMFTKKLK